MDVGFKWKTDWGFECRIFNDDSLKINLEGFPCLQLTFYHTEKADVKCSSQKMAPHVQVRCIHLQWLQLKAEREKKCKFNIFVWVNI